MNSTRSISRAGWQARQTFKKVETLCEKEMCQVWKARVMKEELRMKERGRQNGLATRHVQEEAPVRGTRRHFITRAASHYLRVTWAHWHTHTHTHCDVEHIYGTYVRISIFVFIQQSRPEILCPSPMVAHYDFYDRLSSGGQRMERRVTH